MDENRPAELNHGSSRVASIEADRRLRDPVRSRRSHGDKGSGSEPLTSCSKDSTGAAAPFERAKVRMPRPGIEPASRYPERILSLSRLPISPSGRRAKGTHEHCVRALAATKVVVGKEKRGTDVPSPLSKSLQSGKRDSNPRPQPWQGCALPTELFPRSAKYTEADCRDAKRLTRKSLALFRGQRGREHGVLRIDDEDREQLRRIGLAGVAAGRVMVAGILRPVFADFVGLRGLTVHATLDLALEHVRDDERGLRVGVRGARPGRARSSRRRSSAISPGCSG